MKNFKRAVYLLLGGISLPLMACNFGGNPTTTTTTEAPKPSTTTAPNKSSSTSTQTSKSEYVITFIYGYNDLTSEATVKANEKLAKPTNPARTNYKFDNWYIDDAFTTIYDFNAAVNSDFNLYAKWVTPGITVTGGGYNEGLFGEFTPTAGKSASNYTIKYKLHSASSYLTLDSELIRDIATMC